MLDEEAHVAFETTGVHTVVVKETFLVTYQAYGPACLIELFRRRLYAGPGTEADVREFLQQEARAFDLGHVCSVIAPPGATA